MTRHWQITPIRRVELALYILLGGSWAAWAAYSFYLYLSQTPRVEHTIALDVTVTMPAFFFAMYTRTAQAVPPPYLLCLFSDKPQNGTCINPADGGFFVNGPFPIVDGGLDVGWGVTLLPTGPLPDSKTSQIGAFTSNDNTWSVAMRVNDTDAHDLTVQSFGSRYTDSHWAESYIDFKMSNTTALYDALNNMTPSARGLLTSSAGLNGTGVQIAITQNEYTEWMGVRHPFGVNRTETYYQVATVSYLGADDTDLIWALGEQTKPGTAKEREVMINFASFGIESDMETFSTPLVVVGNSFLAPSSIVFAILGYMLGSGRFQPIGKVQTNILKPNSWLSRQYGVAPSHPTSTSDRLASLEEFMDLLRDHYIDVHTSLLAKDAPRGRKSLDGVSTIHAEGASVVTRGGETYGRLAGDMV
ncbi:hypothetical protein HKX48_006663 [Thoreauomyces humboldtii]|nr:hypothetical protein HKX48_006663 [Thoreauomyces humboldtii]